MGKTKIADKSSKKDKKSELASVKAGRVTKPAATPKSKSKDIAKSVASNVKDKKKSKKAPTPEPESDSSSESESESEDSSESSSEEEVVEKKASAKAAPKAAAKADSDSDSDSSEEDSDSDSSEDEKPAPKAKANGVKKVAAKAESSDSDSDSSESEEEKAAAKAKEAPSKKRKAEEVAEPIVKKSKVEEPAAEEGVKNLFVGNMSWNIDEDWLRREFEGFGEIVGCRVITDRETGRAKGFGYVEFANAADAAKAQKEMHEYELDGRQLNVDFSTPRAKPDANGGARANKYGDKRSPPSNTLFLGNVSFECSNESIQEVFAEYGSITRVSLPTDRDTGALKGFGYVDFSSQQEATAALEALNGQDIGGRAIRIDYATPHTTTSHTSEPNN
ncbi:RNA-binding protein RRM domain [Pyrenophora tritici-repentis]|nr:RNA-binding protein RRM domain [Pyrenophora tritici-repentis]